MATAAPALPAAGAAAAGAQAARRHFVYRFSFGTTAAFILCEAMDWQPSALAPVLAALLLASLPVSPSPKLGMVLILVMAISAWFAFFLTVMLSQIPYLLFCAVGLIMFVTFAGLAQRKAKVPLTLLLICITVTPVFTLTLSGNIGLLPSLLVRGMILAVVMTWLAFAIWPRPAPVGPEPPASPPHQVLAAAALGAAIVLPLMLVFMMFGLTDAMPALVTTVLLVANMEYERSAKSAWAKLMANFLGGFVAVAAFYLLAIAPSLATLALISFLIALLFAQHIVRGGVYGGNALLGYNAAMIIFGLALLKGPANAGTWASRVVQFAFACTFVVAMITLFWPSNREPSPKPA